MRIRFHGAAGTVTGSKTHVATDHTSLLVDCGLFQGLKELRLRNWEPIGVRGRELDGVVLTHAHLDHSGYLPLLVKRGFRGPIWCSPGTADLARILLADAAFLFEEDARRANKYHYSRHDPALPLYTREDVDKALPLFRPIAFDEPFRVGELEVSLRRAGHILGAGSARITGAGRTVFFSGDVGRPDDTLMPAPAPFQGADTLVLESTYGDRRHPKNDPATELATIVNKVCGRGGVLLVPAFAVGRSQALLHLLAQLTASGAIPRIPTYLNSPMAIEATETFLKYPGETHLDAAANEALRQIAIFTPSVEDSKALNGRRGPMILIAGSGMATGGRILHHLASYGRDPNNGILLVGYQAAGTRGQALRRAHAARPGAAVPRRARRRRRHAGAPP